ncbi:MAG: alkaline phosphatase [Bacteroidales bacterium]|nr:alkaline phosphatase [Bacteroidales bacterium]MCF8402756.1 alkaline phosphatase [Bacteroidales bacterium]
MRFKIIPYFCLFLILTIGCHKKENDVKIEHIKKELNKPKNLILLIGDGMALTQITAARTLNGGNLNMLKCKTVGIQSTHCADKYVTDSGAATTAIACGRKTNYYSLGVDPDGNPVQNIIERAADKIYTGLITTSSIVHSTPAAFYAHQADRFQYEAIAVELVNHEVDFFAGGGKMFFDQRSDGTNLLDSLTAKGYEVNENLEGIDPSKKNAVFIANGYPLKYNEGRGEFLSESLKIALQTLKNDKKGFFIMAEGAQIDWAGEENDQDYLMDEMLDFDRAVGVALEFAAQNENTLVLITGDHETGGYALVDGDEQSQTVNGQFVTYLHTGSMVPVFAYGNNEELFSGVYENTAFFYKFLAYFDL